MQQQLRLHSMGEAVVRSQARRCGSHDSCGGTCTARRSQSLHWYRKHCSLIAACCLIVLVGPAQNQGGELAAAAEQPAPPLLADLKFGIGDGKLRYYLFNWRVAHDIPPNKVGLIML